MADSMRRLSADMLTRWLALAPGRKLVAGCLAAGVIATVVISIFLARHATYAVLYTGLETDQASAVVDELRGMQVSFRIADSGRTILVPEGDVYSLRLDLAGKGNPGGGKGGYEIFDKSRFGMTNFMQQVNYRRALEGELTRTIREMDEVMAARVHLVIPERTLFADESRKPSASVMLRLKPGVNLAHKQIDGITYLVAGSVEGLGLENVNIVDYYGNLLSNQRGGEFDPEGNARLEMQTAAARFLEEKAQSLLDQVVGPGNAVVRVSADLDLERIERDSEKFDPDFAVVRSEELNEEAGGQSGDETRSTVTNYEINRTVERVVRAPGNVKRLTVAVTVDGRYEAAAGGKGAEPVFAPRSAQELDQLGALVRNAVGLDQSRGDQFHIACVQFDQRSIAIEQEEMKKAERQMMITALASKAILVLGALAVLFVLRKIVRSLGTTLAQAPARPGGGATGGDAVAAEAARIQSLTNRVSELARTQPEESAALIRTMVGEEK
ncbi:MAG: flagellar basal-body MS-ring/collar protein FliF [Candidatus Eisenbacteria bacterium]